MYQSPIPLPTGGIDQISDDLAIPAGFARRIENVVISSNGVFSRRKGRAVVRPGYGFHSIAETDHGILVGKGNGLFRIHPDSGEPELLGFIENQYQPLDFTGYNGNTYIAGASGVWWIPAEHDTLLPCGVSLPDTKPAISAHENGALPAGQYAVAMSIVSPWGEESPLLPLGQVALESGGGIMLSGISGLEIDYSINVYLTQESGGAYYLAEKFSAAFSQYLVGTFPDGAIAETQHLKPLPGGQYIRGRAGRLYVAQGNTLWFSNPMRPHLCDAAHGYIQFTGDIRFIEPITAGLLVADSRGVWLVEGDDPVSARLRLISPTPVMAGSSIRLPASASLRTSLASAAVIWLSSDGYMVATETADTECINSKRARIDVSGQGKTVFTDIHGTTQVITLTAL